MYLSNQLTKKEIKVIRSLRLKKFRLQTNCFVAEGFNTIREFIENNTKIERIYLSDDAQDKIDFNIPDDLLCEVDNKTFAQISQQRTPQGILAVINIPEIEINIDAIKGNPSLLLDNVQDPGNLGTLIRIADWYGMPQIFCSTNCVDCYNPKSMQSSTGSLARVSVVYTDLPELVNRFSDIPAYVATLDGDNLYQVPFPEAFFVVLGNEGNGVSKSLIEVAGNKIAIPRIGKAESLNVAVSGGIILSELFAKVFR